MVPISPVIKSCSGTSRVRATVSSSLIMAPSKGTPLQTAGSPHRRLLSRRCGRGCTFRAAQLAICNILRAEAGVFLGHRRRIQKKGSHGRLEALRLISAETQPFEKASFPATHGMRAREKVVRKLAAID